MMLSRATRRFAALAAAFGIALQALWPAIAQARPNDSISVPVCSADGVRHDIQLPLGKTKDGSEHCKLCVLGTDKDVVGSFGISLDLPVGAEVRAATRAIRSNPSLLPSSAHPRAPPQVS